MMSMASMTLLLESALKVSAVLLAAFATVWLMRRASAAARHWVLSGAIVLAALTPLFEPLVPSWQLLAVATTSSRPASATVAESITIAADPAIDRPTPIAASTEATAPPRSDAGAARASQARIALGIVWAIGVAINLAVLCAGLARLAWLASRARPVRQARWARALEATAREYGISRPVALLAGDHPALLVTWGWRRPAILLPAAALRWTDERIRVVLSHELAHVRRQDWAMQMIATFLRAIYWFTPLTWIACRQLRQDSEQACDDAVLARGVDAPSYASHLLEFARALSAQRRRDTTLPAQAIARASGLERRIAAMLDVHVNRRALSRSARVGVAAALVALALPIAGLQVFAQTANARLSGTVIDQSSAPVYEASVTLIDQRTQTRRSMPTDRSGRYAFVDVMPGSYRLQVEAVGFRPASEDVRLTDGQMGQQDVRLSIGEVYETITIAPGPGDKDRDNEERATPRTVDITVKPYDPRTEGSIRPPMRIANVTPVYPRTLLDSGLSDHAVLDAKIGTDGSIVDIRVRSSKNPAFAKAAMDAMSQWKYTPTLLHGKPVEVKIVTTIDFQPGAPRK